MPLKEFRSYSKKPRTDADPSELKPYQELCLDDESISDEEATAHAQHPHEYDLLSEGSELDDQQEEEDDILLALVAALNKLNALLDNLSPSLKSNT